MLRNRLYYSIKPLVPASMRMAIRRWFAFKKRKRVLDTWPILPGSEKPPKGWPGWPEGKQFALVLTHDVEGRCGLEACRHLMELELKLGFRSSFNFIPEGEYRVSGQLREELTRNGFEIGVHDLRHDGKLYRSRRSFTRKVTRINQYLKDWGAVGFRSGMMLHNLDWLHDLEVTYDASTFDTDPFEPQPDGVNTIFPFWVPRPGAEGQVSSVERREPTSSRHPANGKDAVPCVPDLASSLGAFGIQHHPTRDMHDARRVPEPSTANLQRTGYVELPYTLAQDSTLFLLFGEGHPDSWFKTLDWIARHGGMALVNVHPDYIRFNGQKCRPRTFPVEFYDRFLKYARQKYGKSLWNPLPKEVAGFVSEIRPALPPKPKKVCMLSYSDYLADARVMRYAETLAERGDQVDVVGLRHSPQQPTRSTVAGVNIIRIQPRFGKNEQSRLSYLAPVLRFLLASSAWIARRHIRKRYDLLHIHNVPDFLVFAGWLPRLTGAKVILDIHDVVPEFYASKFGAPQDSTTVSILKAIERASARIADRVIISNHLWLEKYAGRTGANGKCSVFINNVDVNIFRPRRRTRDDGKLIVLFPGGLQWHQGLDIAIRAFQKIGLKLSQAEFHIYGEGNMKNSLVSLSRELGLEGKVRFFEPVALRQIAEIMANADLGVVPKRAASFGNEAYSTKIMQFMSLGVPVVASKTRIDQHYFDDSVVRFFESGNPDALAEAMLEVLSDAGVRRRLIAHATEYAVRNSWESHKAGYLELVDSLTAQDRLELGCS